MSTPRVLVTCPPMLKALPEFQQQFDALGWEVTAPRVTQTLTVDELKPLVASHDGWIIGDDPANREVVDAGSSGALRAAVKWGVGIDNVDLEAFKVHGIPVTNTPGMFGNEVADIALGYLIALARHTFEIHRDVCAGAWPKPPGRSLKGSRCALVGYGDIGRQLAKRLEVCGVELTIYDPALTDDPRVRSWPVELDECDFICFTCALTPSNHHMLNAEVLQRSVRQGVRVINVSRGPLIDQAALCKTLEAGTVAAVALDVFEQEPLPAADPLRRYPQNIFGTHNASNTVEAVRATSHRAIKLLAEALETEER
ncbi:MAG: phosphoglycerate dehydrogenase [Pseudomonadota bacterium]